MAQIVTLATHNPHKIEEMRVLLAPTGWDIRGAEGLDSPVEDSGTFLGNALIKARAASAATGGWALADDSGLCVDTLDGAPGVDTAYYGGWPKLLEAMHGNPARSAHFVCVLTLVRPGEEPLVFEGKCQGTIAPEGRGSGTFGYDPVFIPTGETRTFAEMTQEEKHQFSHRSLAVNALLTWQKG